MENEIEGKIQESIQKIQRKFYIQEQIRALQTELGDEEEVMPELAVIKELNGLKSNAIAIGQHLLTK